MPLLDNSKLCAKKCSLLIKAAVSMKVVRHGTYKRLLSKMVRAEPEIENKTAKSRGQQI